MTPADLVGSPEEVAAYCGGLEMPDQTGVRIVLYDTTLRDGAQTRGVDFSTLDKQMIAAELDRLGVDYIEAGWPGANPTDDAFFADPPRLRHAKLAAFGTTRRPGRSISDDSTLACVLSAGTPTVCLVGKASDRAAVLTLGVTPEENLNLIGSAVEEAVRNHREVIFDAEHFFDGYAHNPQYALACLHRAQQAGAGWLVLCDTNGGTLPEQIMEVVRQVVAVMPEAAIGVHLHNDTETAVAGSLAAVAAGARMIQGTLNGLGERCGNANLTALIPTLVLKLGYRTGISTEALGRLTEVSRLVDQRLHRSASPQAAYVGENAFAHKAGLHAAAMMRDISSYEHIDPSLVGNQRHLVISNQTGRSNLLARLEALGLSRPNDESRLLMLVEQIKDQTSRGWTYDGADASFELLARRCLGHMPSLFELVSFEATGNCRWSQQGELVTGYRAAAEITVDGKTWSATSEGHGLLGTMNEALRKILLSSFPRLSGMRLVGIKTRSVSTQANAKPVTQVILESHDEEVPEFGSWFTVGASASEFEASLMALRDAVTYRLLH